MGGLSMTGFEVQRVRSCDRHADVHAGSRCSWPPALDRLTKCPGAYPARRLLGDFLIR